MCFQEEFPIETIKKSAELGFGGMFVPGELGNTPGTDRVSKY